MRFLGIVTLDQLNASSFSESDQQQFIKNCCVGDDEVRATGNHCFELNAESGVSLRRIDTQLQVIDRASPSFVGKFNRLFLLDVRDLNDAIRVISMHPAMSFGQIDLFPIENVGDSELDIVRPIEVDSQLLSSPVL